MRALQIEIISTNIENCRFLENNVLTAIAKLGIAAQVNCIADEAAVQQWRLNCTPGLVVNGQLVSQGQNISSRQIQILLLAATHAAPEDDVLNHYIQI